MKILITLSALLLSTAVFAASSNGYKLDMQFSINGKLVSSPKIIVAAGTLGTLTQESGEVKNFFEVVATEGEINGNKGILMKFKVGHILEDGSRKIISRPTILAKAGEEASITIGEEGKKEEMSLKVIATRETL